MDRIFAPSKVSEWAERQVQNVQNAKNRAINFIRTASMSLTGDEDDVEPEKQAEKCVFGLSFL